jgi:hypothetical protein
MMVRRVAAWLLVAVLLATWPPTGALAQSPRDTPIAVGEGAGVYVQAASTSLVGALDRALGALDATPADATPQQVRDSGYRRRLLELRLLMDLNAYAYDRDRLRPYRDIVDRAYEQVGVYQDITDIEKELAITVSPQVTAQCLSEMQEALGPLRDGNVRSEMRRFLSASLAATRTKGGAPRLWDITGSAATDRLAAVGNAAEFQSGIIRHLQSIDLGVSDIFDPAQAAYFHMVRKDMRDVVVLSAMFPPIKDNTRDAVAPLNELVGDYGDTLEAFTAYEFALDNGMDTEKVAAELRREFERAMAMKGQLWDNHGLDTMAIALNGVRDAHRR